jgi:hypothetical protein
MTTENNGLRKCSGCKCTVLLKYFSENKKGELKKTCDTCGERLKKYRLEKNKEKIKQYQKTYYENNKDKIKEKSKIHYENNKEQKQEYFENNKEKIKQYQKIWNENNKEHVKEQKKIWNENNKESFKEYKKTNKEKISKQKNEYMRNRLATDVNFRVLHNLRKRLWSAVKRNTKSAPTKELLGCTSEELKIHLENKFTDGMNWDNYGKWHIDHIIPCCSFDMGSSDKQKECFHFSNLQPLWALDNLIKGGRILLEEGDILDEVPIMPDI